MPYVSAYAEHEPARAEVDALPGDNLLEFGAPWCPHCIGAQSLIAAAFAGRDGLRHLKIEDGPGRPLGRSFRIKLWPSLVLIRDGEERGRAVRPQSREDIEALLREI
jgi:thioredoxin 1